MGTVRVALAVAMLPLALGACGGSDDAVKSPSDVDTAGFQTALSNAGVVRAFDVMAEQAQQQCGVSNDELALGFSLSGSRPDITRIEFQYFCPQRLPDIDAALTQVQSGVDSYKQACQTPANLRTEDQQQLVDAVGPC